MADLWSLNWSDLYPACMTFDVNEVTTVLETEAAGFTEEHEYSCLLESRFGTWTCGWNWTNSEGGGGGLVSSSLYCCEGHSLHSYKDVVAALSDWHSRLLELNELFQRHRLSDTSSPQQINAALHSLLHYVIERTSCEDAWYSTFHSCVIWMFQSNELRHLDHLAALNIIFPDGFHSWVAPSSSETLTVFNGIVASAQPWLNSLTSTEAEDGTSAWLACRDEDHFSPPDLKTYHTDGDGHYDFIMKYDVESKREGILAAIRLSRSQSNLPLSFDLLCSWISIINPDAPAVFRTETAYAKDGLEYYPYSPEVPFQFIQLISQEDTSEQINEDEDSSVHFIERACKAYLDICFFHPFEDGNSRLARVAFDFILFQNGYKILSAEAARALFKTSKYASNREVLKSMMEVTRLAISVR